MLVLMYGSETIIQKKRKRSMVKAIQTDNQRFLKYKENRQL